MEKGEWEIKVVERVKDGDGVGWGGGGKVLAMLVRVDMLDSPKFLQGKVAC